MHRFYTVQQPSYQVEDGSGPNVDIDDDDAKTSEDEENEEDEDSEEDESEDEEDSEDEKAAKEESKDEDEEELARVSLAEIKEKHPNIFKDFPTLKHAFFREQQFTEIFPTVEDARKAAEAQAAYEEISAAVVDGDAHKFIQELKNENPDSLEKFAENFLPALQEANKDAYFNIVAPQVQRFVKNVFAHGVSEKNDNIKNAAKIVHKILFGGDYNDVEKGDNVPITRPNGKDKTVDEDREKYFNTKYQGLYKEVTDLCYSRLDEEIARGLSDLDKSQAGLKRILSSEIRGKVLAEMEKDSSYLSRMKSLWMREKRAGFSGTLKQSFLTAFIAKARTLVAKTRSEVRREALGKNNGDGKTREATRLSGGKETKGGKGKAMTSERQRTEKLSTRSVFDD